MDVKLSIINYQLTILLCVFPNWSLGTSSKVKGDGVMENGNAIDNCQLTIRQRGFTLVELMITIVIIGILAAVAMPLYQSNLKRAKAAEADAALGAVRTALRVYYTENTRYPGPYTNKPVDSIGVDISSSDLGGTYFAISDYTYTSADCVAYTIKVTGSGDQAGINRQMIQDGTLSNF